MNEMGHVVLDIDAIQLFLNKNKIYNINLINHLNNHSAQIINIINDQYKIKPTPAHQLHDKILKIIQQNNFSIDNILHKNTIVSQIISNNKNLKKKKPNTLTTIKKKKMTP